MRTDEAHADRIQVGAHVRLYRRGRRWWAEFYVDRVQRRKSLRTTVLKEADLRAKRLDRDISLGEYDGTARDWTIQETIEAYLAHLATEHRAASTLKRYRPELERFEAFARRNHVTRLRGITVPLVERFRTERAGEVAAATVYHETILIKQLMNYAFSRDLVARNVLRSLKLGKPGSRSRDSYTLEQVDAILAAAAEPDRSMFELLAFTGLRLGELQYLSWADVDLDGGWVHVRAKPDVSWWPKNRKDRKVPLNGRARAALERVRRAGRWVFSRRRVEGRLVRLDPVVRQKVLKRLKTVLRKVGVEDGTVHGFRHFFITHCADSGVPPVLLMRWVGHSNLKTTMGYYHESDEPSQRAMAAVSFADVRTGDAESEQGQFEDRDDEQEAA